MTEHLTPELLAAVAAGDASSSDHAHADACQRCRDGVGAIRRATESLRALPVAEPSQAERQSLRDAIERERSHPAVPTIGRPKTVRILSIAASFVLLVAAGSYVLTNDRADVVGGPRGANVDTAAAPFSSTFTEASVRELLLSMTSEEASRGMAMSKGDATAESFDGSAGSSAAPALQDARDCQAEIWKGRKARTPSDTYDGSWNETPARIYVYRFEGDDPHLEAWVVKPSDCTILHFASQRTR